MSKENIALEWVKSGKEYSKELPRKSLDGTMGYLKTNYPGNNRYATIIDMLLPYIEGIAINYDHNEYLAIRFKISAKIPKEHGKAFETFQELVREKNTYLNDCVKLNLRETGKVFEAGLLRKELNKRMQQLLDIYPADSAYAWLTIDFINYIYEVEVEMPEIGEDGKFTEYMFLTIPGCHKQIRKAFCGFCDIEFNL